MEIPGDLDRTPKNITIEATFHASCPSDSGFSWRFSPSGIRMDATGVGKIYPSQWTRPLLGSIWSCLLNIQFFNIHIFQYSHMENTRHEDQYDTWEYGCNDARKNTTINHLGGITLNPPETNMAMEKIHHLKILFLLNHEDFPTSHVLVNPIGFSSHGFFRLYNLFPTVANLHLMLLYILGGCLQPTQLEAFGPYWNFILNSIEHDPVLVGNMPRYCKGWATCVEIFFCSHPTHHNLHTPPSVEMSTSHSSCLSLALKNSCLSMTKHQSF